MRKTRLYTAAQNLLNPQELLVEVVDLHPRHLPRQTVDGVDSDQEISAGCIGKGRHRRHQWYYVAIRRTRHLELVLDRLPLAHLVGDQRSKSCHIDVFDRYRYHGYFPVRTMMLQLSDVQWTCDRVLALNPGRQRGRAVAQLPAGYELGGRGRYVTLPCASVGVRLGVGARRSCTMGLVRPGPKGRCSVDPYPLLIGAG